jgi:hypothetical protein
MTDASFRRAEVEYLRLRGELDAGRITAESFEKALEAGMAEHDGRWWMLGANSGAWYVHEGGAWTEASPPSTAGVAPGRSAAAGPTPRSGGVLDPGGAVAVPAPAATGRPPARRPPSGAAATVLRGLLGLSLTLASAGVALTIQKVQSGGWGGDLAGPTLLAAAFLLGVSAVPIFAAIPWGLIAAGFAVLALVGFLVLQGVPLPIPGLFWWFPDILFATGLAGLIGSAIGWAISRALSKDRARSA